MVELAEALQARGRGHQRADEFSLAAPFESDATPERARPGSRPDPRAGAHGLSGAPSADSSRTGRTDQYQLRPTSYMKANYQDFERFTPVDLAIAADAEATLPAADRGGEATNSSRPAVRHSKLGAQGSHRTHQESLEQSRDAAAVGWDSQPITTARLCAEIYGQIRNEDWALCNGTVFQNYWPQQLWTATRHHQYIGDAGAYGLGYLPGASRRRGAGAPQAWTAGRRDRRRRRPDVLAGALWTAAHHQIPLLYVVHNNRAYHQEIMYVQSMARSASAASIAPHWQHDHRTERRLRQVGRRPGRLQRRPDH